MYAACDDSVNEYLIMELIVYYRNNDKDITVPDQEVVHIYVRASGGNIMLYGIYVFNGDMV